MSDGHTDGTRTLSRLPATPSGLTGVAVASLVVVALAGFVQIRYGSYDMSWATAWAALTAPAVWGHPRVLLTLLLGEPLASALGLYANTDGLATPAVVVWTLRMPRVVAAVLVGANLAVSGAVFQALTRNELASPYVLGVSGGAGLAVLLTLVFFAGASLLLPFAAAVGGTLAFLLVYAIAWKRGTSPVRLVLAGVVVATVFQSLQTGLFFFLGDSAAVKTALAWITGSLTGVEWAGVRLALVPTLLVLPACALAARHLDVLLLGEDTARSLGMAVERVRFALAALAILAAATGVAVAGLVGFVGLVVPHAVRTLVGSDSRRVVLGCVVAGPALVVVADVGARLALAPLQVPVGVLTGVIGGPYFLYLMRKHDDFSTL